MSQDVCEEQTPKLEETRRRSELMQNIIVSVGSPVFSGWGPRIANVADIMRTLN